MTRHSVTRRAQGGASLRIWLWPAALNVLVATGLASALVSDTWGDAWAWFALGLPLALAAVLSLRRPSKQQLR